MKEFLAVLAVAVGEGKGRGQSAGERVPVGKVTIAGPSISEGQTKVNQSTQSTRKLATPGDG